MKRTESSSACTAGSVAVCAGAASCADYWTGEQERAEVQLLEVKLLEVQLLVDLAQHSVTASQA